MPAFVVYKSNSGFKLRNNKLYTTSYDLDQHIINNVDSRLTGKTASTAKPIFSTLDHNSDTYVRNINNWAYDIDLTALGTWVSEFTMGFTAISPRHVIFAAHYPLSVGQTVRFVTNDNTTIARTITAITIASTQPLYPDYGIGLLNSDLPSSIRPVKILAPNFSTKSTIPNSSAPIVKRIPLLVHDQEQKTLVFDWIGNGYAASGGQGFPITSYTSGVASPLRVPFSEGLIGGDSGHGLFFIIRNELALVTVATTPISGTWLLDHISTMNAIMQNLGGNYTVSTSNLDIFTNI
jgi:hypothetical protein